MKTTTLLVAVHGGHPMQLFIRALTVSLVLLVAAPVPAIVVTSFVEDFTTTTYRDAANTTADWNTVDGELKLFPFTPSIVGSYNTPGVATGVEVRGDLAFVSDGQDGLQVFDVSDPAAPTPVGSYNTPGISYGIDVAGDYAYLADYTNGLVVVDISDPSNPTLAGSYNTTGDAWGVTVEGDYAYVADYASGVTVVDISNPASPAFAAAYDTPGQTLGVTVSGNRLFVADGTFGVQVLDISAPSAPALIGTYDTPFETHDVFVSGGLAYVADGVTGLIVLDVSDPANPTLVSTHFTGGYAVDMFVSGDIAWIADDFGGVSVVDVSDPASPVTLHTIPTPAGAAQHIAVEGLHAYVADYGSGLQVLEVATLTGPTLAGVLPAASNTLAVCVEGNHAFIGDDSEGLQVADITDPANPTTVGSLPFTSPIRGVEVDGNIAYAVGDNVLAVVDVTDPANPALITTCPLSAYGLDVAISGDYAYVAEYPFGLRVVDISNPAAPVSVDSVGMNYCSTICVDGDYAYTNGVGELRIVDISDPTDIAIVGSILVSGTVPNGIAAVGDYAYVTDYNSGLNVFDVSDPTTPTFVHRYDALFMEDLYVTGNLAFVVRSTLRTLEVIDITDPASMSLAGSLELPGYPGRVTVAGDHAFVVAVEAGLQVAYVRQELVVPDLNTAMSTVVDATDDAIVRVRLSPAETPGVVWEFSADAGATFDSVLAGEWHAVSVPGDDFQWRSTHTYMGENPAVSNLRVDWLHHYAPIASVTDIPNDQGRQVRVTWTRSGHDFVADPSQIVEYAVYREIDPVLTSAVALSAPRSFEHLSPAGRAHAMQMAAAGWDYLVTVPVRVQDSYSVVVPTLADSSVSGGQYQTTFMVSALTATPGVFFDSHPDSGYSVDNLAPSVPGNFAIAFNTGGGNALSWDESPDADFQYFRVYRSTDPGFTPDGNSLVHSTTSAGWSDPDEDGGGVYYKVTAVDFSGNESDAAESGTVTSIPSQRPAQTWALDANVPNPFNPTTQIHYTVPPGGGHVTLEVFDVRGRRVRTLVDGAVAPGERAVTWDGRDARGHAVASGVYFYRFVAPGFAQTRKMVLAK